MTLQEFNSKYEYVSDMEQYGVRDLWEIMELKDGKYKGDCESYVLTLKAKVNGFKNLKPYYCENTMHNGSKVGHCISRLGDLWIDCNKMDLVTADEMGIKHYQIFRAMSSFEIARGMLWAKLFKKLPRGIAISLTKFWE